MQFSFFYDYYGVVNSCSFLKKYDALFQAFEIIYNEPNFPPFGRKGYPRSAYLKALIYKQSSYPLDCKRVVWRSAPSENSSRNLFQADPEIS